MTMLTEMTQATVSATGSNQHFPEAEWRYVQARVSQGEFDRVKAYALDHGLTISSVLRELIDLL